MAKITLSVLVADIRQSVQDIVFSKWKGINYVRSRVTPANPNTVAQQNVRNSLARCVDFWQDFYAVTKAAWDYISSGRNYSGFNRMVSENRVDEQSLNELLLSPATTVTPLSTFFAAPGVGSGEIDVTFTPTPTGATENIILYARKVPLTTEKTVTTVLKQVAGPVSSPQTITGLVGGVTYQVYGMISDTAIGMTGLSIADTATATV